MADFTWRAAEASGRIVDGSIAADSLGAATRQLRSRGLTPLHISQAEQSGMTMPHAVGAETGVRPKRGPVTTADVLALTTELAIMLRAGVALDSALRVLLDMSAKSSVQVLLKQVLDEVKSGVPLSRSLGRHPHLFGDFYVNMVRSGETSGQLAAVLTRLVEHMERLRALRDSVLSATIYPAILLVVALLSLVAMLGFVVPQFEKLFKDMGDALPLPTQFIMALGQAFTQYGLAAALLLAIGLWLLWRWVGKPAGRRWWQSRVLALPILGRLLLKYELTLFTRSLGTLLGNGVPMLTALGIASDTVGNRPLHEALAGIAPAVKEGGRLTEAVARTGIFEPLAINLVRVGEETGRIGAMMLELANALNRDVENGIKRALTMLEPAMILVLGVLVAGIIVSILLGILAVNDLAV